MISLCYYNVSGLILGVRPGVNQEIAFSFMMNESKDAVSAGDLMDVNNQHGSNLSSNSGINPLLKQNVQLERFNDLTATSQNDFIELENIKTCLNAQKIDQDSQLFQAINALIWKVECLMKEKNDLLMAESSRMGLLLTQNPPPSTAASTINYETDEETLENETGWTTQKKKKTRKTNFNKNEVTKKPPPIKVETEDVKTLSTLAKQSVGEADNFSIKPINEKVVKINFENSDGYRKMISSLKANKVSFHTYENKQTRPIRVMAKGLHHQWTESEILEELKTQGYKILQVSKKLSSKDKAQLDMFVLSFDRDENIDSIYKINRILHNVVEICPIKGGKLVPQCKNCQEFGHTKNHCNKVPRCVKCAKNHLTINCEKPNNTRAKCANCNGDHPANYRGCTVAKEAQALRKQQKKADKQGIKNPIINKKSVTPGSKVQGQTKGQNQVSNKSWAQVAGQKQVPQPSSSSGPDQTLQLILNEVRGLTSVVTTLTSRVDAIEKRSKPGRKPKDKK